MDESQRHYAKRKKLNKKRIRFIWFLSYKVLEVKKKISLWWGKESRTMTASGFGGQGAMVKEHKGSTWTDDSTLSYQESGVHRCLHLTKLSESRLKSVYFIVCKFHCKGKKQYKQVLNSNYHLITWLGFQVEVHWCWQITWKCIRKKDREDGQMDREVTRQIQWSLESKK